MIVDKRFLDVYTFIPRAAVIVSDTSSHAIAMGEMLHLNAEEWTEMANTVSKGVPMRHIMQAAELNDACAQR